MGIWTRLIVAAALTGDGVTGVEEPRFFRIDPVRPVSQLIGEASAKPMPAELARGLQQPALVSLGALDARIRLDIRYATSRNFLGTPVYDRPRAYLERSAAAALGRALDELWKQGYGLLIHDAYRPWRVTWIFWQATPVKQRDFVADPAKGSRHNRGCAVDLTLYDRKTGQAVEMPSLYDEMSERSAPGYGGGTAQQRALRDLLRREMERQGFKVFPLEWWHFDYQGWEQYAVRNETFAELDRATGAAR
jgi:D-alanyl-D-alanine dipeptidase